MTAAAVAPRRAGPGRPSALLHSLTLDGASVSAQLRIGARDHTLAYTVTGAPVERRYEPFLVAAVPVAMATARSLSVQEPVSPRLLGALDQIQAIFSAWWPDLRRIEVYAEPGAAPPEADRGTVAFFSGGVDSFYTVLRNIDEVDSLVYVRGFELPLHHTAQLKRMSAATRGVAAELGLPLIEVETNLRDTLDPLVGLIRHHGALLASVGLLLGSQAQRVLLPASFSYRELVPRGSHALLDPLWSTERVQIVHEGVAPRVEKVELVSRSEVAMRSLRVCFQPDAGLNCGRCPKCLRTMAELQIVGALERCETLPHDLRLSALARIPMRTETHVAIARSHAREARARGADPALVATFRVLQAEGSLFVAARPSSSGPAARLWKLGAAAKRRARRWIERIRSTHRS